MNSRFSSVRVCLLALLLLASGEAAAADLIELYHRATEYDPTFQIARYRREQGEQGRRDAKAGIRPVISANVEETKTFQEITDSDNPFLFTPGQTDFFTTTYSISIAQPIYSAESRYAIPRARAEAQRAEYTFAAEEQELIFRLSQALFDFLAARDNVGFASAERTLIERQLQESEERLSAGLGTIGAVHEARAGFAVAQAEEIVAQDELEVARLALIEITGVLPAGLPELSDALPLVEPELRDVEVWVETALFQNPRLKALEAGVDAAEQEMRFRRNAGRLPSLDAVGAFSGSNNGGSEFGSGSETSASSISLRLGIPIYDGGRANAQGKNAALEYRIAGQGVEQGRRRVEFETRKAFRGVTSAITRIEALRQSVFSGEAVLAVTEEGLRAGLSTRRDVLDATRELFSARRDLARSRYDYLLSRLSLKLWSGDLRVADLREINENFK